jgi:hypothetical protein
VRDDHEEPGLTWTVGVTTRGQTESDSSIHSASFRCSSSLLGDIRACPKRGGQRELDPRPSRDECDNSTRILTGGDTPIY